jgi:hypothetical protein
MMDRAGSNTTGHEFCRLLIDDVVPGYEQLRGPTIMPEVKPFSATLGIRNYRFSCN